MPSPFIYGKIAGGADFTDREEETRNLAQDFCNLTNTMLISPRRWGKSSLVRYALRNSLTVLRAKKILLEMDILDKFGDALTFQDPVYE